MKKYDFLPSRPPLRSGGQKSNYKTFVKKRSGGQKKQDFCKNAQWRAKKLRERGSNTARPREKGGGGLPIRSISSRRFGRFGRVDSVLSVAIRSISARRFGRFGRFGASIRSRFADFLLAFRGDSVLSVAIRSIRSCRFGRVGRFRRVDSCRFGRVASRFADFLLAFRAETRGDTLPTPKTRHKKSPTPYVGNRASGVARS